MILAVMIFGIPAMLVASKKGFADGRWLLAFGLIGLIVVSCLPSARRKGLSHGDARKRRRTADGIGKVLCAINVIVIVLWGLGHSFWQSAHDYYPTR
jgi:hypothetical protein